MTVLLLWIAFSSVFSLLLGYSRIPYAAAVDGNFFPAFGRLAPEGQFPAHFADHPGTDRFLVQPGPLE